MSLSEVPLHLIKEISHRLTIEVSQFFHIVSQVSRHSQGLSHFQVRLSDEDRRKIKRGEEVKDDREKKNKIRRRRWERNEERRMMKRRGAGRCVKKER